MDSTKKKPLSINADTVREITVSDSGPEHHHDGEGNGPESSPPPGNEGPPPGNDDPGPTPGDGDGDDDHTGPTPGHHDGDSPPPQSP